MSVKWEAMAVAAPDTATGSIHPAACPHDCWDTCALRVHVRGGRVVKVTGDPEHPTTRGFVCVKVGHYHERVHSPDRVLHPLRRVGPKGSGRFERVSWEEALTYTATRLGEVVTRYGGEAVLPYSYAGTMGLLGYASMDRRFFHRLGASRLARTICCSAAKAALVYTYGAALGPDPEDLVNARLILLWGVNVVHSAIHQAPILLEARRRGAIVVHIDPYRNGTEKLADWHLSPRPGTDAALALGMMHVILAEGLEDRDYIARFTTGIEALRERVREWPPGRAAAACGIPPGDIARLARLFATTRPAAIRAGYGLHRHTNGGMTIRALALLPALTGAWRDPGGGLLLSNSDAFGWNSARLERPDLMPSPAPRRVNMIRLGEALTELCDPPIMALVVYNSNPAAVAPNQSRVIEGLLRDDLFTVVHEQIFTDTCRYADVIFPATTQLEHVDLHGSYWHLYALLNEPVIPPLGEAVPNTEFFRRLAAAMGFDDPCFRDSDEELLLQALEGSAAARTVAPHREGRAQAEAALAYLRAHRWVKVDHARTPFAEGGRFPDGRIRLYSEAMEAAGLDPVVQYVPPAESPEGSPERARRFPLQLLTPGAHHFLNSTFANLPSLLRAEEAPTVYLNPRDATTRGIRDGQWVRVWNDRGQVYLRARVGSRTDPGVAVSPGLWWSALSPGGQNVNSLTTDQEADMAGGAAFHTNLVEVEPVAPGLAAAIEADLAGRLRGRLGREAGRPRAGAASVS